MVVDLLARVFGATRPYRTGGLYSIEWGDGSYGVAKVLHRDRGLHVRIYSNAWDSRPTSIDPEVLEIQDIFAPGRAGWGHLPVRERVFSSWNPALISVQGVPKRELSGYFEFRRARAEHFGGPEDAERRTPLDYIEMIREIMRTGERKDLQSDWPTR